MKYKVNLDVYVECTHKHKAGRTICDRNYERDIAMKHPYVTLTYTDQSPNGHATYDAASNDAEQLERYLIEYTGGDRDMVHWLMTAAYLHSLKYALDLIDSSTAAIQQLNPDNEYEDHMGALNHSAFAMRADYENAVKEYINPSVTLSDVEVDDKEQCKTGRCDANTKSHVTYYIHNKE